MLIGLALEMLHADWVSSGSWACPLPPRCYGLKVGKEGKWGRGLRVFCFQNKVTEVGVLKQLFTIPRLLCEKSSFFFFLI